ncbi:MAG TPA: FHA domain-containing protein [Gammaproteobacteria bacterium]|jgi:hypothetical protein
MAILKSDKNGETIFLHVHHVFGRRKVANGTWLQDAEISSVHAAIRWSGERWLIKDHSKNGTWLNGNRMQPGAELPLVQGACIGFGHSEDNLYTVIDLSPPVPLLVRLDCEDIQVIELKSINALPTIKTPEAFVFLSDQGEWICEGEHRTFPLSDGHILHLGGSAWRFIAPGVSETTLDIVQSGIVDRESVHLHFRVSLDEEHTFLKLGYNGEIYDLGERIHHFLLLTLARSRQADRERQIDPAEQGWVEIEDLSKMLGLEVSHTNIQIFRARKQVCEALAGKLSSVQLVERRRGAVRIGCPRFNITRGSAQEVEQACSFDVE